MGRIRDKLLQVIEDQKEVGLTQKELGRRMNCTPSQVNHLLSGERKLSEEWILKFCDALGISLCDLDMPIQKPEEPKEVRKYQHYLKLLYDRKPRAFQSVRRNIDDWLADIIETEEQAQPQPKDGRGKHG